MIDIALIIGVVTALTQLAKQYVPVRFIPLISVVLGVIAGAIYLDGVMAERIFYGIMLGLSAAGLYDQVKITKRK